MSHRLSWAGPVMLRPEAVTGPALHPAQAHKLRSVTGSSGGGGRW